MRTQILSILSSFVTRGFLLGLLFVAPGQGLALSADPTLPSGIDIPSAETLSLELGHKPKDFAKDVDDFALALSQGNQSLALRRICAKDEDSCRLLKDFQEQAEGAKRDRLRARRRGRVTKITDKNIHQAQGFEFPVLVNSLRVENEYRLFSLAEKALLTPTCPRNLSAALAVKAEEYFPYAKARTLSKELFENARPCLSSDDVSYERLYLRQGLYAFYEGDKERSKRLLLEARKSKTTTERYRVLYWLGVLEQEEGKEPKENEYWTELMAEYPLSFYAIASAVTLRKDPIQVITQKKVGGLKRDVADDPELNRMIRWLEALYVFKKPAAVAKWASWIVKTNEDEMDVGVLHYLSTIKIAAGMYRSNISMLFNYFRKNPQALNEEGLKLLYPRPYYSLIQNAAGGKVDTYLVLGLVRQESGFDARAVSRAKAKGLMQIIPSTARTLASGGHRKLLDEKSNAQMGVKYLLRLSERFGGSAELVLAAYNAGPNKVDEWLKRNPERMANPVLWNDLIPYMETRDYVVSILRNNYLYARLYGNGETLGVGTFSSGLVKDLLTSMKVEKKE